MFSCAPARAVPQSEVRLKGVITNGEVSFALSPPTAYNDLEALERTG